MIPWPEIIVMVSGALLAGFFAGAETGAYVLNRLRLRYRAGSGLRRAATLERMLADLPGFVTALLIWTNLSLYLVSAACTALFDRAGTAIDPELAATLAAAPVLFAFSELAPKDLFRRRADTLMLSSAGALSVTVGLVRPLARTLAGLGNVVRRTLGLGEDRDWAHVSRRALRKEFRAGEAQGVFSGPQRLLVENILQAGSRPAADAAHALDMAGLAVPGGYPVLSADATAADLLARAGEFPSSRVPIYESDPRRVVGVVHVLKAWGAPPETKLRDLALPPVRLDGNVSVVEALAALRRAHATMGFLVDEEEGSPGEGRALAVVTVEGLLLRVMAGRPRG
jgi:CBS domain containing-hemolysin-like protein